jgi:hypothetical protein
MADGLLERLERRAAPAPGIELRRGLTYNFPLAWYRRPDGDVVQLQSDPNNRAFYEDLGFVMLRPTEAREWLEEVRPAVVAEQKQRARYITAIRKIQQVAPQFIIDDDDQLAFATMPMDELVQFYNDGCEAIGRKIRLPAIRPDRDPTLNDPKLNGVETSDTTSLEEIQAKMERAETVAAGGTVTRPGPGGGTFQGQGYDPLQESRRGRRA